MYQNGNILWHKPKFWRLLKSLTIFKKMSLSLLQESSLDTEFAFHIRHQNAFLSHLCCYCEDVGFRSPVEGAPNFKMGASGVQEIPIWVVVAEQGDYASRGVEEVRSQWSLVPLPARRWWKLQHRRFEAIVIGDLTSSLAWFEAFLPTLFEFGCHSLLVIMWTTQYSHSKFNFCFKSTRVDFCCCN